MVILVDTNVIIDFLITREPFYKDAAAVMEKCADGELEGRVAFHTIPNLWYILRKVPEVQRRRWIKDVCDCLNVVSASHDRVLWAIGMTEFKDFEDCLQDQCAEQCGADYIVTRNMDDYVGATVPAITPGDLLLAMNKS